MPRSTPEKWAEGRRAWEAGASREETGRIAGVSGQRVDHVAKRDGWQRNDGAAAARAEERRQQTEAAKLAAERQWANRRGEEANRAGITAQRARQAIVDALDARDDKMTRASAVAYGILIDKAQLLSGAATARIGSEDPRERAQNILDELAEKRRDREQRTG